MARQGVSARRNAALTALEKLKIGDVIRVPSGKRAGLAVVLDPGVGGFHEPRPLVLTERPLGRAHLGHRLLGAGGGARPGPRTQGTSTTRSPAERRDLAASLRAAQVGRDLRRPPRPRRAAADDRRARPAPPRVAQAPVPLLPGSGGPRPVGRAALAAEPGHRRRCGTRWRAARDRWPACSTRCARC